MDETIRHVLTAYKTWAVVGCSPDPWRDSNSIAALLLERGYDVVPITPKADEVLGRRAYPSLQDAVDDGHAIEVVDVFRRSDQAGVHVDEAIEIGAQAVWLQLGVVDPAAAARAQDAGLAVVMDRCPRLELPKL